MLPNEKRLSVIVEEENILNPMGGYRNSLPEVEVTRTVVEFTEDEASPQYIVEEIEDADIIETVIDTEENHTEEDIALNQQTTLQESSSDNNDEDIEVISEGAMCKCTMGKKPGNMNVVCQFKVYCNGGSKLVATTQERNLLSLSFGSCTAKNNAPCMPSISWQNYYEDVQIMRSLKILTMESKGVCQAGGGQIEFQTSGQSQSVSSKYITGVDRESLESDNPLLRAEDEPIEIANSPAYEEMLREMEEKIRQEMESTMVILENAAEIVRGKVDKNTGILPVTYKVSKNNGVVKQPKGVVCSFLAAKKGVLTWKVRDDKMQIIHQADGAGTISIRFPKYGRYVIEAYGNSSTVKENTKVEDIEKKSSSYFNTLIIEVAPNEIILEASKEKWYVGGKVEIKATRLFEGLTLSVEGLRYHVAQSGAIAGSDKAEIANTGSGCIVTFKEKGSYVVTADRIGDIEVKPTAGIVIENLRVASVIANNEKDLKTFKGETINVEAKLNYEEGDKEKIKWDIISPDGEKINEGKPQPGDFQKPGTYKVYAYCSNARSESIKATIQINETKFLNINWVDGNNNPTKLIGARERVYARVGFEYSAGMEICAELRILGSDKVIETYPITKMQTNILVISVGPLSDTACKSLQNNQQLYLYIKAKNGTAIKNKNAAPKSYSITYSTAKDIINLKFYIDKECKLPAIIGAYGSTIYAKVVTRNLKQKEIRLKLIHDIDYAIDDTLGTFTTTLNDDGVGIFEIKVEDGWARKNGYWQKTIKYYGVISEVGGGAYKEELTLGKDAAAITFTDKPKNSEEGKVLTKIAKKGGISKNSCPKCKVFTEKDFKALFPNVKLLFQKGTNELKSTLIKNFVEELNKAFEEFGIDDCNRKLHFLTQAAVETGNFLRIDENLNYSGTSFRNNNWPESNHPKLYEANAKNMYANKPEVLANYVYRNSGENGNEASGDGYKYRGRGLIQLTHKKTYQLFENYLIEKDKIAKNTIMDNPDLLLSNLGYLVRSSTWYWKYGKSANGTDRLDMNKQADKGDISKITYWLHGSRDTVPKRVNKFQELYDNYEMQLCDFHLKTVKATETIDYHILPDKIEKYIPKGVDEVDIFYYRYYYHKDSSDTNGTLLLHAFAYNNKRRLSSSKRAMVSWKKEGSNFIIQNDTKNQSGVGGLTKLVKTPKFIDKESIFRYQWNGTTERFSANPDAYAILLAAMADTGYRDLTFNGYTKYNGDGSPSVSHNDGYYVDMRYLNDKKTIERLDLDTTDGWKKFDLKRHNVFVKKLAKRGYTNFIVKPTAENFKEMTKDDIEKDNGFTYILGKDKPGKPDPHYHHIHIQGLKFDQIINKEK